MANFVAFVLVLAMLPVLGYSLAWIAWGRWEREMIEYRARWARIERALR